MTLKTLEKIIIGLIAFCFAELTIGFFYCYFQPSLPFCREPTMDIYFSNGVLALIAFLTILYLAFRLYRCEKSRFSTKNSK